MKFNPLTGNSPQETRLMKKALNEHESAILDAGEAIQHLIDNNVVSYDAENQTITVNFSPSSDTFTFTKDQIAYLWDMSR